MLEIEIEYDESLKPRLNEIDYDEVIWVREVVIAVLCRFEGHDKAVGVAIVETFV